MGFTLKHSTQAEKKVVLLLAPAFIWCLTTLHTKTYITLDFNAVQSKICLYLFFSPCLQCSEYPSCRSKLKSSILNLVKLKFQSTLRRVNKICFVCVIYLMLHQARSQPAGQTTAAIVRSHFLSSLSCLSESTQWYLRAMKIKAHGQIANTVKQFTGCWSNLSQGLWCADIQTFMAAGGHATLVGPRFRTPSRAVCAPARKSMCVTNPTMKLL